jgi:hypothetical protein
LNISGNGAAAQRGKTLGYSDVRLKVRNIDEK